MGVGVCVEDDEEEEAVGDAEEEEEEKKSARGEREGASSPSLGE